MKNIWFRVGMEVEVTDEEMKELLIYSGQLEGVRDVRKAHYIMQNLIDKAELSGETYIVGNNNNNINELGYDNPDEEIDFLF